MSLKRHVALLRGINVGGKHVLPMKDLAAMFVSAGCADVATYIQSGNVVFSASAAVASKVPQSVEAAILKRFRFPAPVQTRSADELRAIVAKNPLFEDGLDPATLAVVFLAQKPSAKQVAALDPDRSPGDTFVVRGREVYLLCPNGFARSKLTNAWLDTTLATISTSRNWRTTLKLLEMTNER